VDKNSKKELDKIKSDPVYFVEKYLDFRLNAWQKSLCKINV